MSGKLDLFNETETTREPHRY